MVQDKILVLDFGGQYTQLIARSVRQCKVFSEIKDCSIAVEEILKDNPKAIILSGGPDSVYERGAPSVDSKIFDLCIPILGICYGMQLMSHVLGGRVVNRKGEYGNTSVKVNNEHILFSGLGSTVTCWMSHGDSVDCLAPGFSVIGTTDLHIAAIANDKKRLYGVQFHPEVSHTPQGKEIISNFVHKICGCGYEWTMANYIEESKEYVRRTVGKNDVICFVSGGVDSSFVAVLLSKVSGIGRVFPVYIEALMRKNETEEVVESLKKAGVHNLIVHKAEDEFIACLAGLSDPEEKRKAIGNYFGKIQEKIIEQLGLDPEKTFLSQGTLYPDTIESGKGVGKRAAIIKSHHNVGCPFIEMLQQKGRLVEPLKYLFKDEVRAAAKELGLPREIFERQPFPGPGLGIRIVNGLAEYLDTSFEGISDEVNKIARKFGLQGYLLPIKTVGVQGDARTYRYLALLRGRDDWHSIRAAAETIPKEIRQVNRIVYDIAKEPLTRNYLKEMVATTVTRETIDQLKEIDFVARKIIDKYGFTPNISQTILVLFAADLHNAGKRSVCLRAVISPTYMTVSPVEPVETEKQYLSGNEQMSWECLHEIREVLTKKHNVGAFVIDVTDKPPATTCWE